MEELELLETLDKIFMAIRVHLAFQIGSIALYLQQMYTTIGSAREEEGKESHHRVHREREI